MSYSGWEWARAKAERQKKQSEAEKRTRKYSEDQIDWQLSEDLLPVRSKKIRFMGCENDVWYTNGSTISQSFVYLLKEAETNEVRYVGLTNDPPRRLLEHQRDKKLEVRFKMVVVAVGDADTEHQRITDSIVAGCKLTNIVKTK